MPLQVFSVFPQNSTLHKRAAIKLPNHRFRPNFYPNIRLFGQITIRYIPSLFYLFFKS